MTTNNISLILYLILIILFVLFLLKGNINISILFLVPFFPLRNVLEKFSNFPLGKDFIDLVLLSIILGWVIKSTINKDKILINTPFNTVIFLIIFYTYFSLWRGSFYLGLPLPISFSDIRLQNWKNFIIFPLLYLITVNNIKNVKEIKWLIIFISLSMLIVNYYTLNQIRWITDIASRIKIKGTFVHLGPNELAAFFTTYTFIILGILFFNIEKILKFLFSLVVFLNSICILFLYSRGAYIAFLICMSILAFIKKRVLLIILIFFLFFWKDILPYKVVERIEQTKTEDETLDASSQTRIDIWKKSIEYFKSNPIIGMGFSTVYFLELANNLHDTHNIYLKILVEQGIIGFIFFLLFIFLSLKNGIILYKNADDQFLKGLGFGFTISVVSLLILNFFGDRWTYHQVGAYFWVILGLVVRANIIVSEEKEKFNQLNIAEKT